jgi:cytochrome P450
MPCWAAVAGGAGLHDVEYASRGWLSLAPTMARFQRDPVACLARLFADAPPSVVFGLTRRRDGPRRRLVITRDPAVARATLSSREFRNSSLALPAREGTAQYRLRRNLFRLHGDEHRRHQQLIAPFLRKRAVEGYRDAMLAVVDETLARWTPGVRLDVASEMKTLARRIASTTLFGQADLRESDALGEAMERWFGTNFRHATRLWPRGLPGGPRGRLLAQAEEIESRVRALVARKRREGLGGDDMMSRLVGARDARGGLSEEELVSELHVLFLAAHETTAYALTWTLFLIAQHPHVANTLVGEIEATVGEKAPTVEQLDGLQRLTRAVDESLRIIPVVPYGARVAVSHTRVGPFELARGSRVLVAYAVMHHRPEVFPEPERFDPDRWVGFEPTPYTYLPFSAGPHMCLGPSFAILTLRLVLARILQRFRPRVVAGARIDRRSTVTLSPRHGMPMQVLGPEAPFARVPVRGNVLEMVDLVTPEPA